MRCPGDPYREPSAWQGHSRPRPVLPRLFLWVSISVSGSLPLSLWVSVCLCLSASLSLSLCVCVFLATDPCLQRSPEK